MLVGALQVARSRRALTNLSQEFAKISVDALDQRAPRDLGGLRGREPAADGRLGIARRRHAGRRHGGRAERHDPARPLLAGPHREGQIRRDGPDPRPRRRNTPNDRRADATAPEQSDPHRRGRRRQDRGGRGLRAAHRRGRRSAAAAGRPAVRARHRPDAGWRVHEGRVRAATAVGDRRGAEIADARSSCSSTKHIR